MPEEIVKALEGFIDCDGLDYADNYRFAPQDDESGKAQYYAIRDKGCCGAADYQTQDNMGRWWILGCNHGH